MVRSARSSASDTRSVALDLDRTPVAGARKRSTRIAPAARAASTAMATASSEESALNDGGCLSRDDPTFDLRVDRRMRGQVRGDDVHLEIAERQIRSRPELVVTVAAAEEIVDGDDVVDATAIDRVAGDAHREQSMIRRAAIVIREAGVRDGEPSRPRRDLFEDRLQLVPGHVNPDDGIAERQ